MKTRKLLAGLAMGALLATTNAHAYTYYLGSFNGGTTLLPEGSAYHGGVGSLFTDFLNFSVASDALMQGTVTDRPGSLFGLTVLGISNLDIDLWQGTSYSGPTSKLSDLGTGDNISFNSGALAAGNYFFKVTGHVDGLLGGVYEFSVSAAPVPEPSEWMMLLAGVGLLGLMVRRREEQDV